MLLSHPVPQHHPGNNGPENSVLLTALCLRIPPPASLPFAQFQTDICPSSPRRDAPSPSACYHGLSPTPPSPEPILKTAISPPSTPPPPNINTITPLSPPSLRINHHRRRCNERLIRGLWNPDCVCLFSKLHNDMLMEVLSYISLKDTLSCTSVCRRWRYAASHDSFWRDRDFSSLVHRSDSLPPPPNYSQNVTNLITRHAGSLKGLQIRDVGIGLSPSVATEGVGGCLSAGVLRRLTLTGFTNLTDDHVRMLLLAQKLNGREKGRGGLEVLRLEQCPMLTDRVVVGIAECCPNLEELSLRGNKGITDGGILAIRDSLKRAEGVVGRPPNFASFLFLPPLDDVGGALTVHASVGGDRKRKLTRLDVSRTGVTARGVVELCSVPGERTLLDSLKAVGSGESWTDGLFLRLSRAVSMQRLTVLEIGCKNPFRGSIGLTDQAFSSLRNTALERVGLAGHKALTGTAVARLLRSSPNLQDLDLGGCNGLTRAEKIPPIIHALSNHEQLRRLVLWRCFPDGANPSSFSKDETYPPQPLDSIIMTITASPSKHCLVELDLEGCHRPDPTSLALLKISCPHLNIRSSATEGGALES